VSYGYIGAAYWVEQIRPQRWVANAALPEGKLMPSTHRRRRRDETVLSRRRRRCEHEFATSWRQFRRVFGVNTPVGSRDPVYNFLC